MKKAVAVTLLVMSLGICGCTPYKQKGEMHDVKIVAGTTISSIGHNKNIFESTEEIEIFKRNIERLHQKELIPVIYRGRCKILPTR